MTKKSLIKRIILWTLYYLFAAALVALSTLKYPEKVVFVSDSWFPAVYALCNLLFAVFLMSKLNARLWISIYKRHEYVYRNRVNMHFSLKLEHQFQKEIWRNLHLITLAFTPVFFIYIPFFSVTAKHFCGFLLLLPSLIYAPISILEMYKETEEHNEDVKKEREEQERREELGKWK